MTIRVALKHRTEYRYDRPVSLGAQTIRLRPAPHARTPVSSYALIVEPEGHFLNWQQDPQANWLARVVFPEKVERFSVEVRLIAEMDVINPFDFFVAEEAETFPFAYDAALEEELRPYRRVHESGPLLNEYLKTINLEPQNTVNFIVALNARLQSEIGYVIRMEPGIQPCDDTLRLRSGSCRDSGWLLVQILRHLGLAARFVSGYLIQLKPDVKSLDGPSGATEDFTDLHAWCEVYLPGAGWIGLDPTSGLLTGEGHIPLAASADPQQAAPISGLVEPANVEFGFEMTIERIHEDPRVTKPYTPEQWTEIDALGDAVDAELKAGDVRLTMGGEPTFVSIDDMEAGEWTTDAVGPTKRGLADELIRRLRDRFAPGGLLHYGQGKWYPGESLPRWAFALYWRGDGMPLWSNPDLIAREKPAMTASIADAEAFAKGMATRLGIDTDNVLPAFEDPAFYTEKSDELPVNVTPDDSKIENAEDNARLKSVFRRGLDNPVSVVLPVQRWNALAHGKWRSEKWKFRKPKLYLAPGDSPAGLRLPLGSLPWVPPSSYPYVVEDDPFIEQGPLPAPGPSSQPMLQGAPAPDDAGRQTRTEQIITADAVRTAMAFEPRDGKLCIFMPPVENGADYVELISAIEDTARELNVAVHVEGYTPPGDARLNVIKVTPDPGVIEVNIHPATNWRQQVEITRAVYEEARLTRLGAEKFMIDGRHTGTGGGNHIVLGGRRAADSPFLRRPDLLGSLIRFWQNHPALSYLFSGLFIGPTSQAPRVDEARHDSLYELEIALKQVPAPGEGLAPPPWLVDRLFRNLLIDSSGNTHRSEICIDKLYSPDGPTGRLGLVEFRGFEMPPHAEMSLAQGLLLRALIARFWKTPYKAGFVRWGTSLHDKFMLPHFVRADLADIVADMNAHGYALKEEWFAPHFEFRFPVYGRVERGGVELELRQALEPWHVMGEEGAAGGTVRYVDSSVERLQLKLSNATPGRHLVTVNGRAAPLAETGTRGELVAGVRFRAWAAARSLHPTIKPHGPLLVEIVDSWSGRSLGGCTYHVAHPAGRNYETFPVNAYEAEGRRLARFEPRGQTAGPVVMEQGVPNPDFPLTLDLRR
ncbi:hypothetical protein sos41_04610 [Alphaproteobacteria bacterium SO-S41]|nr:hypothetical protein sos41_04610 [Alphaproteobacteria bacterium SO-S41]